MVYREAASLADMESVAPPLKSHIVKPRLSWIYDFAEFARTMVQIRDKNGNLRKLDLNGTQRIYWKRRQPREIILKFRQPGFSTLFNAELFWNVTTKEGFRGAVVAHERDATQRLKARIDLMYDRMQPKPVARYNTRRELTFDSLGSTLYIGTAGGRAFGRGDTIHYAHCSEFAFWPDPKEALTGLTQAIPADGAIKIESTPNGFNDFYQLCQAAKTGEAPYTLQFFPWFIHPEYRLPAECDEKDYTDDEKLLTIKAEQWHVRIRPEQITWRRQKQSELDDKFLQEYPEDEQTCFLTSGRPRFNVQLLNDYLVRAQAITDYSSERIAGTLLTLSVWAAPEAGKLYTIGADSAEGKAAGDNDAACVIEWATGRMVASLHGKAPVFAYAQALYNLGMRYNCALLAVERNHPGPAVIAKLAEFQYPNLYYAVGEDGRTADEAGWHTNAYTRPTMVDNLDEFIDHASYRSFPNVEEIGELMSFVVGPAGKAEASQGAHDDRVVARAIALAIRQSVAPSRPPRKARDWNPAQL